MQTLIKCRRHVADVTLMLLLLGTYKKHLKSMNGFDERHHGNFHNRSVENLIMILFFAFVLMNHMYQFSFHDWKQLDMFISTLAGNVLTLVTI